MNSSEKFYAQNWFEFINICLPILTRSFILQERIGKFKLLFKSCSSLTTLQFELFMVLTKFRFYT